MLAGIHRRLRLLGQLSLEERLRVAHVAPWVVFFRLGLRRLPFRRLARHALRPTRAPIEMHHDAARRREIDAISHAVTTTSALLKGTTTCLVQALAVVTLLRRRGIDAELCVGVAREDARSIRDASAAETPPKAPPRPAIAAHAWVEVDGRVVHGATTRAYQRFPSLEALLRSEPST